MHRFPRPRLLLLAFAISLAIVAIQVSSAFATVSSIDTCSLDALKAAVAAGGEWVFTCSGNFYLNDSSQWGLPPQHPLTLAPGENLTLAADGHVVDIDGGGLSRLFVVPATATLRLSGIKLSNGAWLGDGTWANRYTQPNVGPGADGASGIAGNNGSGSGAPNGGIGGSGSAGSAGSDGSAPSTGAQGGAIFNQGRVELANVTLSNNVARGGGGASGGAGGDGGGGGDGGVGLCATGPGGSGGNGGAGSAAGNGGASGESGVGEGGAIFNAAGATLLISGSTFTGNSAVTPPSGSGGSGGNGGWGGDGGPADNESIGGNGADGGDGGNAGVAADGVTAAGGAIYNAGSATIGGGTTFASDHATGFKGGNGGNGGSSGRGGDGGGAGSFNPCGGAIGMPGNGGQQVGFGSAGGRGSDAFGGGIFNAGSGVLTLAGSTSLQSENTSAGDGGSGGNGGWARNGGNGGTPAVGQTLGSGRPGADGGNGGDAMGADVFSLGTLSVSSTTNSGATGTCTAGVGGAGGVGGRTQPSTVDEPSGTPGTDGSACLASEVIAHPSGTFAALAPDQGEPVIAPFPTSADVTPGGGNQPGGGTPPTNPPIIPPVEPLPASLAHLVGKSKLPVKGSKLTVALGCASGGTTCSNTVKLTTIVKKKVVTIASGKVTLAPGASDKLKLRLSSKGRNLLGRARGHRLKAKLAITSSGLSSSKTLTLTLAH